MIGASSGGSCMNGSNNTFLGRNTGFKRGITSYSGSIALGTSATITNYNKLMVASNITAFNIPGLIALAGTGLGTILEFDSAGNVLPTAGTYKTVLAIDTAIATINVPYAMSWAANSKYTYSSSATVQALAIWDTLSFGHSANMATKMTWTCPAAGLLHIASVNEGITTQWKSIFLNLATGNTLEWYLLLGCNITMAIGGGNYNSGNTTFNAIRIAPGYTAA